MIPLCDVPLDICMFRWNAFSFLGYIQKTITEVSKNLFVGLYITFAPFPIANVVIISYQRLNIKNYLHMLFLDFCSTG